MYRFEYTHVLNFKKISRSNSNIFLNDFSLLEEMYKHPPCPGKSGKCSFSFEVSRMSFNNRSPSIEPSCDSGTENVAIYFRVLDANGIDFLEI